MESTGIFWKPLFNLLEDRFQLLLVNARDIKQVPGRKTDVKDCEWIADLLRHGLLKASFVPDRPQRELRELVRYRTTLVRERSAEVNRLQKTLEGANIKLASVASDPLGLSGREMLNALIDGSTDVASMAELARGKMRAKRGLLERALAGGVEAPPRVPLTVQPRHHQAPRARVAPVALGHSILIIVYHVLSRGEVYHDLGVQYFDEGRRERLEHGLVRRLQDLGYKVTLEAAQPTITAA